MSEEKTEKLRTGLCEIVKVAESFLDKRREALEKRVRTIAREAEALIEDLDGFFGEIDEVSFEDSVNRLGVLVKELDNELHKI